MDKIIFYINFISIILVLLLTITYAFYIVSYENTYIIIRFFAFVILIAAIYLALNKNTYIPHIGHTIIPFSLLSDEKIPINSNKTHIISLSGIDNDNRIIYWEINEKDLANFNNYFNIFDNYINYSNAGISIIRNEKTAIYLNCSNENNIINNNSIKKHIYYRIINKKTSILSPINYLYIEC